MHGREILAAVDIHAAAGLAVLQSCQSSQIHQVPRTPAGQEPPSLTHHLPGHKRRSQAAAAVAARATSSTSWSRSSGSHLGRGRLGLGWLQIRKGKGGCPGGAGAEPPIERDQGMHGGRGSQAFKVLVLSTSFPTRGPARHGPSQPQPLLPGPASSLLLPLLASEA